MSTIALRLFRPTVAVGRLPLQSTSTRSFATSTAALKASKPSARTKAAPPPPPPAEGERPRRVLSFKTKSGFSTFKTFLPVTPSLRHLRQPIAEHLHKGDPHRALTEAKRATGGRNDQGRITTRGRGGGHKRRIRLVDFIRKETGEQNVERIEYDPGRSAHIALIKHKVTGDLSYILAPATLREGDVVQSFRSGLPDSFMVESLSTDPSSPQTVSPAAASSISYLPGSAPTTPTAPAKLPPVIDFGILRSVAIKPGNCLPIRLIPVGTVIHGITLTSTGPAILARSAGSSARIISASSPGGKHAQIKLNSGEVRLVGLACMASIGSVSNPDHQHENLGKAGRMRWLGFKPVNRGMSMNAYVAFAVCESSDGQRPRADLPFFPIPCFVALSPFCRHFSQY